MPSIKKNKQPQPNIKPSEYKKLNKKMKTMVDWNAFGRNSVSKITSPEYENSTYSGSLQQKIKEKEKDLKGKIDNTQNIKFNGVLISKAGHQNSLKLIQS